MLPTQGEASAESAAENVTEGTPEVVAEGEGNAAEHVFHSASEFRELSRRQRMVLITLSELNGRPRRVLTSSIPEERRQWRLSINSQKSELEAIRKWILNSAHRRKVFWDTRYLLLQTSSSPGDETRNPGGIRS